MAAVIAVCCYMIFSEFYREGKEAGEYDQILSEGSIGIENPTSQDLEITGLQKGVYAGEWEYWFDPSISDNYDILANKDISFLADKYKNLIGWIYIPGTNVNYPVMSSDGDEYLYKNYKGDEAASGSILVRKIFNINPMDDNVTIDGHNMRNGSMFGSLKAFMLEDSLKNAKYVYFDTQNARSKYRIFSCYIEDVNGKQYTSNFSSAEEKIAFFEEMQNKSQVDFGEKVQFGENDKIITLSTCTNLFGAGSDDRLVMHCVLVNE